MSLRPMKPRDRRVAFSRGVPVRIAAIDGTWSRRALMMDASDNGAKLALTQPMEGLQLKEFFLVLSTTGSSVRRCEVAWINGDDLGVRFIEKMMLSKMPSKLDSNQEPYEI